jgi:hypothetical protein
VPDAAEPDPDAPDELVFNGVDGATGGYLHAATTVAELGAGIQGEEFPGDSVADLKYRRREPDFGLAHRQSAEDLAQAGWALVAAADAPQDVLDALAPLRALRAEQAGDRYREFVGTEGLRPGDDKRAFLRRHKMGSAMAANPERVPYYLLLVGGPESIPYSFQYQLDVQYAVGRIAFDTVEDYAAYAQAVVAADGVDPPHRGRLFGPRNPADRATKLSATQLVAPLAEALADEPGWEVQAVPAEGSTKAMLTELLSGDSAPLLLTASHGVGFRRGHPLQREVQGALVCADWNGPLLAPGVLPPETYFGGADADRLPGVGTRIMLSFACFSAGTPLQDDFVRTTGVASPAIADSPFLARLPQRLLAHPAGGALAYAGHVERAWGCSFITAKVGPQDDVFRSTILALIDGWRIGHAMEYFNDRYAALTTELQEVLDGVRLCGDEPDERLLTRLWTENNDARSYVVLGDPAVRLCVPTGRGGQDGV